MLGSWRFIELGTLCHSGGQTKVAPLQLLLSTADERGIGEC